MLSRRNWVLVAVSLFLIASLAACGAPVQVPDRNIDISVDTALAAQDMLMSGMMMGGAELTESEFSSLLTVLLDQNSGDANPVDSIKVWFQPDNEVVAQVALVDGVLPKTFAGNSLDLSGKLAVEGGMLKLMLDGASAGGFGVSPAMLGPINDQINAALAGLGSLPVNVTTSEGMVNVGVGM
ncbi:MAG: hypothetical protein ACK2UO_21115 [Caldilineaceae bacterium]|jgi:hypothetical protein